MKRFLVLLGLVLFTLSGLCQDSSILLEAQQLFASGKYTSSVEKFEEAETQLSGRDKKIAQLLLNTAKVCAIALDNAKEAESLKDYDTAISEYQKVLDANPEDTDTKQLLEKAQESKRNLNPLLSVSRESTSFPSSGGSTTITVSCSMDWTFNIVSSTYFHVSREGNSVIISCQSNPYHSSRSATLEIRTANGVRHETVSIYQEGLPYSSTEISSTHYTSNNNNYSSYSTSNKSLFHIAFDCSMDLFEYECPNTYSYSYPLYDYYSSYEDETSSEISMGFGMGMRVRMGDYSNILNIIGGVRYFYAIDCSQYTGLYMPLIANINLQYDNYSSWYIGCGYEFALSNDNSNSAMLQIGFCDSHSDFSIYCKPAMVVFGMNYSYYF